MPADLVLLLTHSGDYYVPEQVAAALARRGVEGLRLNTDTYPATLDLELGLEGAGPQVRVAGHAAGRLRGVWARRILGPPSPEHLPQPLAAGLHRECFAHWIGLEDLLSGVRWVNPPQAEAAVEGHKLRQLREARAAGLRVPDTLVTNDPAAARAFCARHGDDVVAKLLTALSWSMEGSAPSVRTHALRAEDLAALDELRAGPMCFQPRVRAREELRVAWVEGRCFAGAIGGEGDVDWRATAQRGWRPGQVDPDTAAGLTRLMRRLGLSFGAIDLILPEDGGPPVFLEVNPAGEWGMLEHSLDLPISDAIADALLQEPA